MLQKKLPLNRNKNKDACYLAISSVFVNNPFLKAKLFEFCDFDIERVFEIDKNDLELFKDKYPEVSIPNNFFSEIDKLNPDKIYNETKDKGIKYITFEDENYPEILKNIDDFPILLYFKGSFLNINFDRILAIVGSRKATDGAKENVRRIVSGFKNSDITIVSGLASGIDSASHKAAIENDIKTIAVIGSGFDFKYPSENAYLYDKIEQEGLLLSEYPNYFRPLPFNFPQRNRIITGLSKGVLVAEARMKSGAMISARTALEQGRELMCIPGLITNPNCEGIYHLIKNGAGVITNTEDILNILGFEIETKKEEAIKLTGLELKIYEHISMEEISIEGLKQKLDVGINELMLELTNMELKGLIILKNGLYYVAGRSIK